MRVLLKNLNTSIKILNTIKGTPQEPYKKEGKKFEPQAKCFHLSQAYGGYSLHQMSGKKGCTGIHDVFKCGHVTKKDLYNKIQVLINQGDNR